MTYVELHCHSAYSFLDGASLPEELVERAYELGYKALALTDHDGVYGSMTFAHAAKERGIQPITGVEATLTDGSHVTLLVESKEGYARLCRLLSDAHLENTRGDPSLCEEALMQHNKGIILLTGCRKSRLATLTDQGQLEKARRLLDVYVEAFGKDNVWIELQQNFVRGDTRRIKNLVQMSRERGIGVVATNNVHYHERRRHRLHDVLTAIKHQTTLDASHRLRRANSEFYLKSPEQMQRIFSDLPEALRATVLIADRCRGFDLTEDLGYEFPDFEEDDTDAQAGTGVGATGVAGTKGDTEATDDAAGTGKADRHLRRVCEVLLEERYGVQEERDLYERAKKRLDQELDLIQSRGLSGFFLVYRDLLRLAEEVANEIRGESPARQAAKLPPGRGRGSSVSSLVCYLIGLSHVDPVKNNLSIERFLNDNLQTVPDIDLDFARDIREALILKVYEKYGREHAGLVCSFSTYRLRSAVREIGKVLGLPPDKLDRLAKLSDRGSSQYLKEAMLSLPEFQHLVDEPLWKHLIELAEEISGFPRHISQHVGGMIISSKPLVEFVPLQKANIPGRIICQWDKDACDDAGFIKVDFLSLGMLSLVEEAVEHIATKRMAKGLPPLDLSRIRMDDPAVYDEISKGHTIGVFQIESRAQIQLLPRVKPRNLDDLAISIALIRPGPIIGGAVHPYVNRRVEKREAEARGETYRPPYDHPLLEPVLSETLGVVLFQDHVLQVAVALAGFTYGEAERFRRTLGKRNAKARVKVFYEKFMVGTRKKGVPDDIARSVFKKLLAFSEFGFPKSHSYAFGVLAYQSAWLLKYYPAEYTVAILNSQPMGFYPPHVLVRDAERRGVVILGPDINRSKLKCTIEGEAVRIGISYVKGMRQADARAILMAREDGPFHSIEEFVRRVDLPRAKVERLIRAGLFESIGINRREAMWRLGLTFPSQSLGTVPDKVDTPGTRRDGLGTQSQTSSSPSRKSRHQLSLPIFQQGPPVDLPSMTPWEEILHDFGMTGLSVREHLMSVMRKELTRDAVLVSSLHQLENNRIVFLAGLVTTRQRPETAKGVIFLLVEDETGMVNVVIRPDLYAKKRAIIRGEQLLMIKGKLQKKDGVMSVLALDVWPLSRFVKDFDRFFNPREESGTPRSRDFH